MKSQPLLCIFLQNDIPYGQSLASCRSKCLQIVSEFLDFLTVLLCCSLSKTLIIFKPFKWLIKGLIYYNSEMLLSTCKQWIQLFAKSII